MAPVHESEQLGAEPRPATEADGTKARRVVMLVDNQIAGDSRVQKQARSMAGLGWEVTLVGRRRRPTDPGRARFAGVPTRLVHVPPRAGSKPRTEGSTLPRNPIAYPTARRQRFADAMADAALLRARTATAALRSGERDFGALSLGRARARTALARVRRRVVDHRIRASEAVRGHRDLGTGIPERLATRWWQLTRGLDAWERLDPGLWDWELAYGPVVDRLRPDIIHANDHRMLHVAVRAKLRAAAEGRRVRVVWDAHEYLPGIASWSDDVRWHDAQVRLQRRFAPYADAVVTVSDVLADLLADDHGLAVRPAVVLNAPDVDVEPTGTASDIRSVCGLDAATPLVVYSGGAAPQRGLDVMVEALPHLPGVHTAFVVLRTATTAPGDYVRSLIARAEELGVADRVHVLPYVAPEDVVPFLRTADVGVFPGLAYFNHTISLITKFLEYSHARLPIVVSEVKTMAETVRSTGQGEVFQPGDPIGYASAVRAVLTDPVAYTRAYDDEVRMAAWTWQHQARILDEVYRSVLGGTSHSAATPPADRIVPATDPEPEN